MNAPCPTLLRLSLLLTGMLLLLAGGLLYVLYRPTTLLLFHAAYALGLHSTIAGWRLWASACRPPAFIVYTLPAGLWALSYVLIVAALAVPLNPARRLVAMAAMPLLGLLSELMQGAGLLPGIFDWGDLALYVAAIVAAGAINPWLQTIKGAQKTLKQ